MAVRKKEEAKKIKAEAKLAREAAKDEKRKEQEEKKKTQEERRKERDEKKKRRDETKKETEDKKKEVQKISGGKRQKMDNSSDDPRNDNNEFNSDSELDAIIFDDESDEEPWSTTFKKMVQKISVQFPPITEKHALLYLRSVWSNICPPTEESGEFLVCRHLSSRCRSVKAKALCWESDSPISARKRQCCTIPCDRKFAAGI